VNKFGSEQVAIKASLAAAISLVVSSPALAQDDGNDMSFLLEEITVTAQKREESIQDVSASVTAVGAEMIARAGIQDITRLEHIVPGLRIGQSGSEARPAMRGSRTNNVGTQAEQVVGIFQDGVYVATTTQALGSYVDVSRIEVLRGPQGTLYGRNTFGGTINIISNDPDFEEFSGKIQGLYGDYDRKRLEAVVNIPVNDQFAIRFAGMTDDHDGYIKNTYVSGTSDDLDAQDTQIWRLTAKWQPSEDFEATLRYSDSKKDSNTTAVWGYQQISGYVDGQLLDGHQWLPDGATQDAGPWQVSRNIVSTADLADDSLTLSFAYHTEFATLKLMHNQTSFEGEQFSDFDYSDGGPTVETVADWSFLGWNSSQETESTEFQVLSNGDGALEWMLGYYKYEQDADWGWISAFDGVITPYGYGHTDYYSESEAFFGNATYSVNDKFRVLGGLRSNEDTKDSGGEAATWSDTLWKFGFEYDLGEESMAYFTASTGFRAGGFNSPGVAAAIFESSGRDVATYDPEAVTAYEIGWKATLNDGKLILNVAAYMNEYTDMQAQSFFTVPGESSTSEFTENGGEIDASGLEVELKWIPSGSWYIAGNIALMDAEFGSYDIAALNGLGELGGRQDDTILSLEGWAPALSPELTAGVQVSYDFDLGDLGTLTPLLQATYTSDYFSSDINLAPTEQEAHTKSDLRLIWNYDAQNIRVEAYVLNIEDEAVLNRTVPFNPSAAPDITSIQANWSRPRTWGVSASYSF